MDYITILKLILIKLIQILMEMTFHEILKLLNLSTCYSSFRFTDLVFTGPVNIVYFLFNN